MTDLVERLKTTASVRSWAEADEQRDEAADEIERLRAEVAALRADLKPDIARAAVTALGLWPAQDRNIPLAFIKAARNYHRATVDAIDAAMKEKP